MISFTDLPLHPSVAAALEGREYATATPVQAAVLDPALLGKDLLVSAPTGSGKTVAFGTLIAQTVLAEKPPVVAAPPAQTGAAGDTGETEVVEVEVVKVAPAPARRRGAPRALVVAPTRELANQVAKELGWLLAKAKLEIGSFTGGTSVPGDLRRLRAGLDVVVGTPGRLVDLHERGSLDLSAIEVLVLDEADEMLDLGFREALEYLLGKAPKERRTLMFSATLPPDINRMAATYQRNAVRVDPRAKGAAAPHADIEHFAHLVRPQDRLAAVVNVLTAAGNGKAIVFCRTREGVGELHQRLIDHGFRAVAMSGDRAQGDRDRALGSLRSGRARILVATNVAARGLDLPDVELVLHADLPENGEALTHRSGRTGRAGRKGKSVVIADMRERRKAERLLAVARTQARWTPAPTAADVRRALVEGLLAELMEAAHDRREAAEAGTADEAIDDGPGPQLTAALADRLRAALPERVLIAELLARELSRLPAPMPLEPLDPNYRPEPPRLTAGARVGARGAAEPREPRPGSYGPGWTDAVLFRVNLGANANAEPGWLLPLICRRGGVTRREVGAIRVGPQASTFEISAEASADFALAAAERDPRAPNVTIVPADAPETERPRPMRDARDAAPARRDFRGPAGPGAAGDARPVREPRPAVREPAPVREAAPVEEAPPQLTSPAPVSEVQAAREAEPVREEKPAPVKPAPVREAKPASVAKPAREAKPAPRAKPQAPAPVVATKPEMKPATKPELIDGLDAIDDLVDAREGKPVAKPAAKPEAKPAKPGKASERPAPYFAAASGKRGSAVQVERGPRLAPPPARPRPETPAPRADARPMRPGAPAPRYGAGAGPARGPRFGGARLDRGPGAEAPRGDGGFEPPRFDRRGPGGPRADYGQRPERAGPRAGGGGFARPERTGFSPRPGGKALPSASTADRPRRGRPRSPS